MLERYWPDHNAVNACIKNEAETADVSVLLAVHQPTPLVQRVEGSGLETPSTEQDLLDAFTTQNVPGGYLLVPITGASGAGKSHIVRWLDAQLRRSTKSDQYHIIRIPKSASLRKVVELILEPLKGDPRYLKPWQDLTRAVSEVKISEAVVTFRAHLENVLNARHSELLAEFRTHPERAELRQLIGHTRDLPKLFTDAALDEHFQKSVLSRVVSRALRGRSDEIDDEDALPRFIADDLVLPKAIDIGKTAQRVRDYYLRNIATVGPERLQPIVDLLNDAIDSAISNVFQLEQSTGGITLQDIILAVREILFEDGKDLVLLVEDFAALAGIQEVLLKVCIQEGEYEGKKVRATMRTALALTDGYLSFRDTILTRARREWVVGGRQQSDEEIKAGVVELVGSYLNAARWGAGDLSRLFNQRGAEESMTHWLPTWRNEDQSETESDVVAAFGHSAKGDALFPFNRQAIELLSERFLAKGGRLEFNPRRVINEILRSTLLMREHFETRSFPTPEFLGFRPNANLARWISQTHQPEAVARRLSSLLSLWGGNPTDITEIKHVPPEIFSAFHLPTPAVLANIDFVPPRTSDQQESKTVQVRAPAVEPTATEDPKVIDFRTKLDKWSAGAILEQRDANELRKALMAMVEDAIDWPALRIRAVALPANWIEIPNSRGNMNTRVALCSDAKDEDGSIRAGLLGAYRFAAINNRKWTYPEADDDYVASAAIVDRLVKQIGPMLVKNARAEASSLSRALVTQARIIGLEPATRLSAADTALEAVFSKGGPRGALAFEDNWDRLRLNASAPIGDKPGRERLQSELFERTAAFQGTGKTPFAIDIVRLLDAAQDDEAAKLGSDQLSEEVRGFIRTISEARLWPQLTGVIHKLKVFQAQIGDYLDDSFDKAGFIANLQDIVRLLAQTGTQIAWPVSPREFERQIIEFQASAIQDLVGKIAAIVESDREQLPKVLNSLGALDLELIERTITFLGSATNLVAAAEMGVAREENDRKQVNPAGLVAEITANLAIVAQTKHIEVAQ